MINSKIPGSAAEKRSVPVPRPGLLSPIVKWAGGKEQELKYIIPNMPVSFENYYEPFVGGGSVYTAIDARGYFINDRSSELIALYRSLAGRDSETFFNALNEIIFNWDQLQQLCEKNEEQLVNLFKAFLHDELNTQQLGEAFGVFTTQHQATLSGMFSGLFPFEFRHFFKELHVNVIRKIKRMKALALLKPLPEEDLIANIETAFKSALYMQYRYVYNNRQKFRLAEPLQSAVFLFIRNYAYSGMFRYNASGGFNVPYGGMMYNRKNFSKKIQYLSSTRLKTRLASTTIYNGDFEDFLIRYAPTENDFIFLDPPYDSDFSTYAQNEFTRDDQQRLASYLLNCKAKWMLVIKYTPFIAGLYSSDALNIQVFDKKYLVSFMNRNDKNAEHLMITNYSL